MPKQKNPEARVVEYFETAPIEAAQVVHSIVKGILTRRAAPAKAQKAVAKSKPAAIKPTKVRPSSTIFSNPEANGSHAD